MMRATAILLIAACRVFAQTGPRFEAADVHPSGPAMNPFTLVSGGVLRGDRYDLRKATMLDLIRIAYKVPQEAILGGPNWLEFDRFDIAAKAPANTSPETIRGMLQSLLTDRFHLAVHNDVRPMPAWVLSMGRQKVRLSAASGEGEPDCIYLPQPPGSNTVIGCRNMSTAAFAARLRDMAGEYFDEPVTDGTGLEGLWDFDLHWNRRYGLVPEGADRITIFDAVERQLGLSLSLREAPAPVLVIDRASKPTPNAPDIAQKLPPRELAFDVASLKLDRTGRAQHVEYTRGGIEAIHADLLPMVGFAWDVSSVHTRDRIIGLPKGIESVYVEFTGKTAEHTNSLATGNGGFDDDLRAMLRALFVERFQIQWHYEDRPVDTWSLVPGRPKLKKADPANRASCHEARSPAGDPREANPLLSELISCRNVTIAQFASRLQQVDDNRFTYPVEDETGMGGTWDFDLTFTPLSLLEQSADASAPNRGVPLPDAIAKQLGLKLEKRKRMLPVAVIEHMELIPVEN